MTYIRKACSSWAKRTYREGLQELEITDKRLLGQVTRTFTSLQIMDAFMDGYSCERLPKTEESRALIAKTYTEIFHNELQKRCLSPASYLVQIVNESISANANENRVVGAVARGLRTLSSLLREPDFAIKLREALIVNDCHTATDLNAKQDTKDHTDVLLEYKGNQYRIWLYQFSLRGLPHDIERLTGKRGELPDGIHIICPLHTESAIKYEKLKMQILRLEKKSEKNRRYLQVCSERALKKKERLCTQLKDLSDKIRSLKFDLNEEQKEIAGELDVVNGWFFYSEQHILRIADYIHKLTAPTSYERVVEILSAPEQLVGSLLAFRKGD